MSIIRSVSHQWNKAEFAYQLEQYLAQDKAVASLFVGSTSCQTVCLLVAAICKLPPKSVEGNFEIRLPLLLDVLLQCFLLLYVKEVEHQTMSQSEQLILSLTEKIALQIVNDTEQEIELIAKAKIILSAMEKLKVVRAKLRHKHSNMG